MARFQRGRSLRPVNSIKHVIDAEGTLLQTGATSTTPICVAVPNVDTATFKPGDVRVGATVNGFFLSIFVLGASGAGIGAPINWYIIKLHDQQSGPGPGSTGVSMLRNQIFHEEKGLGGSIDGTPMAFKGVIAVPKSMRRMREGDQFQIVMNVSAAASGDASFCIKAIFKSYF